MLLISLLPFSPSGLFALLARPQDNWKIGLPNFVLGAVISALFAPSILSGDPEKMKFGLIASSGASVVVLISLALRLFAPSPYWAKEYGGGAVAACLFGTAAFAQSLSLVDKYAYLS